MEASFIEIYNNQLRDLLGTGPAASSYISDQHAIKHDPDGGHTIVAGKVLTAHKLPLLQQRTTILPLA